MVDQLRPFKQLNEEEQAIYFHSRERRRSLLGKVELHRTALIALPTTNINVGAQFPDRTTLITLHTRIRITDNAGTHRGLIFEFGSSSGGMAAWVQDDGIGFTAGDGVDTDKHATGVFLPNTPSEIDPDWEMDLIFAVRPGSGRIAVWAGSDKVIDEVSADGDFTNGAWSDNGAGSFASAAQGTDAPGVPGTSAGAPDGFEVIAPLSIYLRQVPRHFV